MNSKKKSNLKLETDSLKEKLKAILQDFKPNKNPTEHWILINNSSKTKYLQNYVIDLPSKQKSYMRENSYMIFLTFIYLNNYTSYEIHGEKFLWEIYIKYKKYEYILGQRKFGFDIRSIDNSETSHKLGLELINKLSKSFKHTRKLLEFNLNTQIDKQKITMENEYPRLLRRYTYFKEQFINISSEEHEKQCKNLGKNALESVVNFEAYTMAKESHIYLFSSILDSFYSLLEFMLIGTIPFLKNTVFDKDETLVDFINRNWVYKFQRIFDTNNNEVNRQQCEILKLIKLKYRNPFSHGHLPRNNTSIYVHMPVIGAIPFYLDKHSIKISKSFKSYSYEEGLSVVNQLDEFLNFVKNNNITKYGIMYLERGGQMDGLGLPLYFDKKSISLNRRAMKSEEIFQRHIDRVSQKIENVINTDW